MDQQTLAIVIVALAALVIVAVVFAVAQQRRQERRARFGPEYERLVETEGDKARADRILAEREQRVKKLDIRPLPDTAREQFVTRWRQVQARFVDDPRGAVTDADVLIGEAMEARGYPVSDFEQRAADVSVEHPQVVVNYRTAHDIARRRDADTEDLRKAMVHYRSLFEALVSAPNAERIEEREETHR